MLQRSRRDFLYPHLEAPKSLFPRSLLSARLREKADKEKALARLASEEQALKAAEGTLLEELAVHRALGTLEANLESLRSEISQRKRSWFASEFGRAEALAAWEEARAALEKGKGGILSLISGRKPSRELEKAERECSARLSLAERAAGTARREREEFVREAKALKDELLDARARAAGLRPAEDAEAALGGLRRELAELRRGISELAREAAAAASRPPGPPDLDGVTLVLAREGRYPAGPSPAFPAFDNVIAMAPRVAGHRDREAAAARSANARKRFMVIADFTPCAWHEAPPAGEDGSPAWHCVMASDPLPAMAGPGPAPAGESPLPEAPSGEPGIRDGTGAAGGDKSPETLRATPPGQEPPAGDAPPGSPGGSAGPGGYPSESSPAKYAEAPSGEPGVRDGTGAPGGEGSPETRRATPPGQEPPAGDAPPGSPCGSAGAGGSPPSSPAKCAEAPSGEPGDRDGTGAAGGEKSPETLRATSPGQEPLADDAPPGSPGGSAGPGSDGSPATGGGPHVAIPPAARPMRAAAKVPAAASGTPAAPISDPSTTAPATAGDAATGPSPSATPTAAAPDAPAAGDAETSPPPSETQDATSPDAPAAAGEAADGSPTSETPDAASPDVPAAAGDAETSPPPSETQDAASPDAPAAGEAASCSPPSETPDASPPDSPAAAGEAAAGSPPSETQDATSSEAAPEAASPDPAADAASPLPSALAAAETAALRIMAAGQGPLRAASAIAAALAAMKSARESPPARPEPPPNPLGPYPAFARPDGGSTMRPRPSDFPGLLSVNVQDGLGICPLAVPETFSLRARGEEGPVNMVTAYSAARLAAAFLEGEGPARPLAAAAEAGGSQERTVAILAPSPSQARLCRALLADFGKAGLKALAGEPGDFEGFPPLSLVILDTALGQPVGRHPWARGAGAARAVLQALALAGGALVLLGPERRLAELPADGPLGVMYRASADKAHALARSPLSEGPFQDALDGAAESVFCALPRMPDDWWRSAAPSFQGALRRKVRLTLLCAPPPGSGTGAAKSSGAEAAAGAAVTGKVSGASVSAKASGAPASAGAAFPANVPAPAGQARDGPAARAPERPADRSENSLRALRVSGALVLMAEGFPGFAATVDGRRFFWGEPGAGPHRPWKAVCSIDAPRAARILEEVMQLPLMGAKLGPGSYRSCPACGWPFLLSNRGRRRGFGDQNPLKLGCTNPSCALSRDPRPLDERWPYQAPPACREDPKTPYERVAVGKREFWVCPRHPDGDTCPRSRTVPGDPPGRKAE
jgi:hypothetical protein